MKENKYLVESSIKFLNYSLDDLAILSNDDKEIKEELYFRLENLIKIKMCNFIKHKYGDESDILYNIYLASERSLKFYDKKEGPFLKYWNSAIEKSLLNYKIKTYYFNKTKIENEIEFDNNLDYESEEDIDFSFLFVVNPKS